MHDINKYTSEHQRGNLTHVRLECVVGVLQYAIIRAFVLEVVDVNICIEAHNIKVLQDVGDNANGADAEELDEEAITKLVLPSLSILM